ncbi:MAG: sigma-54 dependent transcriptional regulator [Ferruginibacter sp.]
MTKSKVLIIDDDIEMCRLLEQFFSRHNFEVLLAHSGKRGLEQVEKNHPDVVLSDFRLGDTDGKTLLIEIKKIMPEVPVIIITGYREIKIAVEVMKHGAYDYITKPLFPDEILLTINKAIEASKTVEGADGQNTGRTIAQHKISGNHSRYIFGSSKEFRQILNQIDLVAPTNLSVIISGESGSGKEVIAQEIHSRSKRRNAPFIAIDCGVLSNELAASELFGHEKGSFTGAANQKTGSLELANGGTIFLDEIANLSFDIQASLLRVVQERKLRRVGGVKDIDLDIRIIVASNDRLWEAAKKGRFREDLFYRFNEFSITVPPLRERKNDILVFADFFLAQSNEELEKAVKGFKPEVEDIFKNYNWPGNLRELKNVVKRSALLSQGELIDITTLPFELVNYSKLDFDSCTVDQQKNEPKYEKAAMPSAAVKEQPLVNGAPSNDTQPRRDEPSNKFVNHTLKTVSIDAEYEMIVEALKKSNFNKSKAAKLLKVDRKTLYNKMKQHDQYKAQ